MSEHDTPYPLWEALNPPSLFGRPDHTAVRAEGTKVLFADGQWRLCAKSGLWNVNLGYGNRAIADAIHRALTDASYLPLYWSGHQPAVEAATALLSLCGTENYARIAFSTSGGAANDLMMKLVRQYWAMQGQFERRLVVGLKGSFHGLTYGSHGLSGYYLGQEFYSVDQRYVRHVSHEDPTELTDLLHSEGDEVAAVVVEPVLGSGAFALSEDMLTHLQALREQYGFLLVADEVATGFGRTGRYFASQAWSRSPDVLLASKAMTNGTCAAAAVIASHQVCGVYEHFDAFLTHAETQAGTPPTAAAIVATIAEMDRLAAIDKAQALTKALDDLLDGLTTHPLVSQGGGLGCFRAVRLQRDGENLPAKDRDVVVEELRRAGVIVSSGNSCVQIAPALVYDNEDLELLQAALRTGLDKAAERLAV